MKRALPIVILMATACGPNMDALRWRAAHDLNCDEDKLTMTPLDAEGEKWGLRGCDLDAAYAWSRDGGKSDWVMLKKPSAAPK